MKSIIKILNKKIKLKEEEINSIDLLLKNFSSEYKFDNLKLLVKIYKRNVLECQKYIELLKKLENYDESIYINKEEYELLVSLKDEVNIEEFIDCLTIIGANNSLYKRNDNVNIEKSIDPETSISDILKRLENVIKHEDEILNKSNSFEFIKLIHTTYDSLSFMKKTMGSDELEEALIFKNEIEIIDNLKTYNLLLAILIIEIYEKANYDDINLLLNKANSSHCNDSFDPKKTILECKKIELEKIVYEYYIKEAYVNFKSSYSSMLYEDLLKLFSVEELQNMKIMELIHSRYSRVNTMTLEEINTFLNDLKREIDVYKNLQQIIPKEDEIINVDEKIGIEDVRNYVVFPNIDKINNDIETIMDTNSEVNISLFKLALCKLYMIPSTELFSRKNCKPIMETYQKTNSYNIYEEKSGLIRICFKAFNSIDGHVIYEVIGFAYGACGDRKKKENLHKSLKEYSDNYSSYNDFESKFKKGKSSSYIEYIEQGLDFYHKIGEDSKKKKLGEKND